MTGPWYLYLDESGDLGFDPTKKGRSRFFTICILAVSGSHRNKTISASVCKTIRRKLNTKVKKNRRVIELKGSRTTLEVKDYLFRQIAGVHFGIYALTVNKERVYPTLTRKKERLYNYWARLIMDQLPFEAATVSVNLILDKHKSKPDIVEFNSYIQRAIEGRLQPHVPIRISHEDSVNIPGIQVEDLFCYGIFRKYESNDAAWFEVFQEKVRYETLFLPPK